MAKKQAVAKKKQETDWISLETERFSFETSRCYWHEIANNLELWAEALGKEVAVVERALPDSFSFWTLSSNLADAKSVAKVVRAFVDKEIDGLALDKE